MSIVVFGGCGFIGTYLAPKLRDHRNDVILVDNQPEGLNERISNVDVKYGDVTDFQCVDDIITNHNPSTVINLAYKLTAETSQSPHIAIETNCLGMDNVFRASIKNEVGRMIFASSMAAYGKKEFYSENVNENEELIASVSQFPMSLYSATKQLNEYQAKFYKVKHGLETVGIRPGVVFGRNTSQNTESWRKTFVSDAVSGKAGTIPLRPDQPLSMVYVEDVARLLFKLTTSDKLPHQIYNTGGHSITVQNLINHVEEVTNGHVTSDPSAKKLPYPSSLSHERAKEDFDFELTSMREAIQAIANKPPV